jgi:hypothetical protein
MKNITRYLTLVAAALAAPLQAQVTVVAPTAVIYNSVTSNLPVSSVTIDCSKQQNIAVEWTIQCNGAGTDLCGISFYGLAVPGSRSSAPINTGFMMAVAANGTTPVIVSTNFDTKGFSRLDVGYITNGVAGLLTNTIRYTVKRNAP